MSQKKGPGHDLKGPPAWMPMRSNTMEEDQHGLHPSRESLPSVLEQLKGNDLLWVLNETVRRKPDLHNWIAQVALPFGESSREDSGTSCQPLLSSLDHKEQLSSEHQMKRRLTFVGLGPGPIEAANHVGFPLSRSMTDLSMTQVPIVQFSSAGYFCNEDETTLVVEVIRIGSMDSYSEVEYSTREDTAKSGVKYEHVEGKIVFAPGEDIKDITIPILSTHTFEGVTNFFVDLHLGSEKESGATLGKYLKTTKVKIADSSFFPSDRFRELIVQDRLEEIPMWNFLYEFFKHNFLDPAVRSGTIKGVLVNLLHDVKLLCQLYLDVYLIDQVLVPKDISNGSNREASLLMVIVVTFLLFGMLHSCDYQATKFGTGGASRKKLLSSLLRRFLHLDESARYDLDNGQLIAAMSGDVDELVFSGYMTLLKGVQSAGGLVVVVIFQLTAPIIFHRPWRPVMLAPLLLCPLVLVIFMGFRKQAAAKAEVEQKTKQTQLVGWISFIVNQYRIIADYNTTEICVTDCEAQIAGLNVADVRKSQVMLNNTYFSPWVALVFVSTWMWLGGIMIINSSKEDPDAPTLGMFLANLATIKTIGDSYTAIFKAMLEMQSCIDSLQQITYLMNLPTDLEPRRLSTNMRRVKTAELKEEHREGNPEQQHHLDQEPLILENVEFQYSSKLIGRCQSPLNLLGRICLEQGTLSAFIGPSSEGKKTLLRILAGVIIPDNGLCFVPSHLRVLHVTADTCFYRGTLLKNLTIGMDQTNPDSQPEHVLKLLKRFGATYRLMQYFHGGNELPWAEVLSQSECQTLNVVRCMAFNPEVLCMDKPMRVLDDERAHALLQHLREFVSNRGLEQNPETLAYRRPRTCVFTTERHNLLKDKVDAIVKVSLGKGICLEKVVENDEVDSEPERGRADRHNSDV